MSRYPSSAELAAFRRSIPCTHDHTTGWEGCPFSTLDRAHDSERRDGIGHRDDDWLGGSAAPVGFRYTFARREASALRSRAYARMDYCACQHPDRHYGNLPCRVTPASSGIPLGPNGYCWSCWSAKHDQPIPTDTWSEDDEPRHPLPIRYQPSFVITR